MSCLNDLEKSDINNLAAASVPLKLHQDNKSAHQTYKEIQGRAEARESSEHHGQRMMGGWVGGGGRGVSSSSLTLLRLGKGDEEHTTTIR